MSQVASTGRHGPEADPTALRTGFPIQNAVAAQADEDSTGFPFQHSQDTMVSVLGIGHNEVQVMRRLY